jgi:[ribosomal protein S5]-alanine N-acetyltransferase
LGPAQAIVKHDKEFAHPPSFTTERLHIRPLKLTDATAIFEFKSDGTVTENYGQEPKSMAEVRAWVRDRIPGRRGNDSIFWVFTSKRSDAAIGSCCFWNFDSSFQSAELGYELHPAHWGKGTMTEALRPVLGYGFSGLGLHRIEACPLAGNESSKSLLVKLGFKYEGKLRERAFFRGRYIDQLYYGLLKEEWSSPKVAGADAGLPPLSREKRARPQPAASGV